MARKVLKAIDIDLPDGRRATAKLFQSPHRVEGRQIVVYDIDGKLLFDTNTCYDAANAEASAAAWLGSLGSRTEVSV